MKFQLFPDSTNGNIHLPYDWLPVLVKHGEKHGIEVFASVFDPNAYRAVYRHCKRIKFSYNSPMMPWVSQAIGDFGAENVIVSGDVMHPPSANVVSLYCVPEYPVKSVLDFEGIFLRFEGFSDHTLGIQQALEACRQGARIIEKHFRLDDSICDCCEDAKFALRPKTLKRLVNEIKWNILI